MEYLIILYHTKSIYHCHHLRFNSPFILLGYCIFVDFRIFITFLFYNLEFSFFVVIHSLIFLLELCFEDELKLFMLISLQFYFKETSSPLRLFDRLVWLLLALLVNPKGLFYFKLISLVLHTWWGRI